VKRLILFFSKNKISDNGIIYEINNTGSRNVLIALCGSYGQKVVWVEMEPLKDVFERFLRGS
tara:strand:+ start:3661 stop:3846 length:186 start_codon:yes stop_codon:yes gene_type:complete